MMWRRSLSRPGLGGLPAAIQRSRDCAALPRARGEAEDLDLDAAALERARQDVGAHRRDGDRPAAHRAGIVDQQGHDRVAELGLLLALVGERMDRVGDDAARAARRRAGPPRDRTPRRATASPAAGAAAGWRAARPRPADARAAGRAACAAASARRRRTARRRRRLVELGGEGAIDVGSSSPWRWRGMMPGRPGPARIVVAGAGHQLALRLPRRRRACPRCRSSGTPPSSAPLRARRRRLRRPRSRCRLARLLVLAFGVVALVAVLGLAEIEVEIADQLARRPWRRRPGRRCASPARGSRGRPCLRRTAARDRPPASPRAAAARRSAPRAPAAAPPRRASRRRAR